MKETKEKLIVLIKDSIRTMVKQLAQIDKLVEDMEDYDKLNKIDSLIYFDMNETFEEIFNVINTL